jgi:hypothetical protein
MIAPALRGRAHDINPRRDQLTNRNRKDHEAR